MYSKQSAEKYLLHQINKLYHRPYLPGKSDKAKPTASLRSTIKHDNRIDHWTKLLEEPEELTIRHC